MSYAFRNATLSLDTIHILAAQCYISYICYIIDGFQASNLVIRGSRVMVLVSVMVRVIRATLQ